MINLFKTKHRASNYKRKDRCKLPKIIDPSEDEDLSIYESYFKDKNEKTIGALLDLDDYGAECADDDGEDGVGMKSPPPSYSSPIHKKLPISIEQQQDGEAADKPHSDHSSNNLFIDKDGDFSKDGGDEISAGQSTSFGSLTKNDPAWTRDDNTVEIIDDLIKLYIKKPLRNKVLGWMFAKRYNNAGEWMSLRDEIDVARPNRKRWRIFGKLLTRLLKE